MRSSDFSYENKFYFLRVEFFDIIDELSNQYNVLKDKNKIHNRLHYYSFSSPFMVSKCFIFVSNCVNYFYSF